MFAVHKTSNALEENPAYQIRFATSHSGRYRIHLNG